MRTRNTAEGLTPPRYIKAFLFGILAGAALLAVIYLLFAALYTVSDLSYGVLLGMVFVATALSGFFSGFTAARMIGSRGLLAGGINGLLLSLLFLAAGVCFFSAGLSLMQGIKMLILLFSSVCGGIFGVNSKKIRI